MASNNFKRLRKQHTIEALRKVPKPCSKFDVLRAILAIAPPISDIVAAQPMAEPAPDGGFILEEEHPTVVIGREMIERLVMQGMPLPPMPMPVKLYTA